MVNDIIEALPWLLEAFPILYQAVAINLFMVCDWQSPHHMSPYNAHFRLSMVAINKLLMKSFHHEIFHDASALIQFHLRECWGDRITFAGFRNILLVNISIIYNNYSVYLIRYNTV